MHSELAELLKSSIYVLVLVLGFLLARLLKKLDSNQTELFDRLHSVERDLYQLQGEHVAIHRGVQILSQQAKQT